MPINASGRPADDPFEAGTLTIDYGGGCAAGPRAWADPTADAFPLCSGPNAPCSGSKSPPARTSPDIMSCPRRVTAIVRLCAHGKAPTAALRTAMSSPIHGVRTAPRQATAPGQTGTEAGGLIVYGAGLPECTTKIYTIAGDLVWQTQHSDTNAVQQGQEPWNAKRCGGILSPARGLPLRSNVCRRKNGND